MFDIKFVSGLFFRFLICKMNISTYFMRLSGEVIGSKHIYVLIYDKCSVNFNCYSKNAERLVS